MANENELRRLEITFPLFPLNYLDVINELTCTEHDFQVCCSGAKHGNNVVIHTRMADKDRAMFENYQCVVDFKPTISEMLSQVKGILKDREDNHMELNYTTSVIREGMCDEYIDEVKEITLEDDDIKLGFYQGCDGYINELTTDEQENLLENIIDQADNEDYGD